MSLAKFGDLARQEIERQRLTAGNAHRSASQALEVLDLRFHPLDFAGLPAQIVDKDFTGGGEPHAAWTPVEQSGAKFVFQIGNPAIDRRCGDVEPASSLADRPGAGNFVHIVQNPQMFHAVTVIWTVVHFRHHSSKKSAADGNTDFS